MSNSIVQQDFASLIEVASQNRPIHVDSTFIRVDLWGKKFYKPLFTNYSKEPSSKKYLKAVATKSSFNLNELIIKPGRGNTTGVWVHPLIASHYASWLNADFAVIVNDTFRKFLDADVSIALSVIDRNINPEDLKRIELRAKAKASNIELNAAIKSCGGVKAYSIVADINNIAVTGQAAKDLKIQRGVKQTRDGMSTIELAAIHLAELAQESTLRSNHPSGDREIASTCRVVASDITGFMKKHIKQPQLAV